MDKSWELPNPFLKEDHTLISTVEEWEVQRKWIKDMLAEWMYGVAPPNPGTQSYQELSREAWGDNGMCEKIRITTGEGGRIVFDTTVFRPVGNELSIPVVFLGWKKWLTDDIIQEALVQGFCLVSFAFDQAAPDSFDYLGASCATAYPGYSWKVLSMWAWMASRVIDWLQTVNFVDNSKIVVTGHSRFGKAALCCGIYDERVAVCAPAGSGCGGMGSLRLTGGRMGRDVGEVERIGYMLSPEHFGYWLADRLAEYGRIGTREPYRENELPFDANFLGAMIAPRRLLLMEGLDDTWSNPYGTQAAWMAAGEVFAFLDAGEHCAIHYREGGHRYHLDDWKILFDFCKASLNGIPKRTDYKTVLEVDAKSGYSWRNPRTTSH